MPLSDVSIGIKTFIRNEKLRQVIRDIEFNLPECQMIIADDGDRDQGKMSKYDNLRRDGHIVIEMAWDSGFGAKANAIADALGRPYLLIGSDDFSFDLDARKGIEKLVEVLDNNPEIDIASGRVWNRPYEFNLIDEGDVITEVPVDATNLHEPIYYVQCDLTVNYCLVRKRVFRFYPISWDQGVDWATGAVAPPIGGGEHGAWWLDCKRAGLNTVWVPGVSIKELPGRDSQEYRAARARAYGPERPCFKKRGIKCYVLGNGQIDYEEK